MEIKRTQVSFTIAFTGEELKVLGKALHLASSTGGRIKDDREAQLARDLNLAILDGRKRLLEEQVHLVDGVLERIGVENVHEPAPRQDP